jgi:hypothetical protein
MLLNITTHKLAELKIKMIAEATKDASTRAKVLLRMLMLFG